MFALHFLDVGAIGDNGNPDNMALAVERRLHNFKLWPQVGRLRLRMCASVTPKLLPVGAEAAAPDAPFRVLLTSWFLTEVKTLLQTLGHAALQVLRGTLALPLSCFSAVPWAFGGSKKGVQNGRVKEPSGLH